jgi:hypothetical protein
MQQSVIELIANPRHYTGTDVQVTGYLVMTKVHADEEDATLFIDRESARMALTANSISVRFGPCKNRLGSEDAMKAADPELLPSLPGYALVSGIFEPSPDGAPMGYGTICAVTRVTGLEDPEQGVGENSWWNKNAQWGKTAGSASSSSQPSNRKSTTETRSAAGASPHPGRR